MKKIILLAIVLLVFAMFGCKKDKSLDAGTCSVSDEKVETIGSSANISGSFVSTGTVENMIIVYGTAESLESAISASCTLEGQRFSVDINDLSSNTKYFYCFEFSNKYSSVKTGVKSFQTLAAAAPTVVTGSVSDITQTSAVCGGEVTSDGGATVTARGFCWSTTENPTISDSYTTDGCGTGLFTSSITGLAVNTTYYVRAYATNSVGTNYGEQKSFSTLQSGTVTIPTVTTSSVSNITQTTATCGGNVTSDGGTAIIARGVCWSTSQNPTISNSYTTDGSGTGLFTSSITGLTENTTYYVRAYATNSKGTSYGEQKNFTTQSGGGGTHEYVDLGLPSGLLWATCNVGADSPEDYGDYLAWGETTPKSNYTWETYRWCNGSYNTHLTKYCTKSNYGYNGFVDNKTVLEPEDDAACANWGGDWRMPTNEEWQELHNNTTSQWTTQNGVYGRLFTSTVDGHSGVSLFFPAAGCRYGASLSHASFYGYYWSSSLRASGPNLAYYLGFNSDNVNPQYYYDRDYGFSVRPVRSPR